VKFKYLLVAFIIFIISILLVTVLLPSILIGPEFTLNFSNIILPIIIIIILIILGLSIYIFSNYRLLLLLEREDWPALAYYLEQKIYVQNRYNARKVRILSSTYLIISDYNALFKLENKMLLAKPAIIKKNALIFGAARILSGNYAEAAVFLKTQLQKNKVQEEDWIRWYYGFSNLLGGTFSQAEAEFLSLIVSSRNPIVIGLSAYFLTNSLAKNSSNSKDCLVAAEKGREKVIKKLKKARNWKKEIKKMENDIHIAIIRKYIELTGNLIFDINSIGTPINGNNSE